MCVDGNPPYCLCEVGWTGMDCEYQSLSCFGLPSTDPEVCSGHGVCVGPDECACDLGWTGEDCSGWECFGMDSGDAGVCSGRGECVDPNQCECETGWAGDNCERCYYEIRADINDDCRVDFLDLAYLAAAWLVDCITDPYNIECIHPD